MSAFRITCLAAALAVIAAAAAAQTPAATVPTTPGADLGAMPPVMDQGI